MPQLPISDVNFGFFELNEKKVNCLLASKQKNPCICFTPPNLYPRATIPKNAVNEREDPVTIKQRCKFTNKSKLGEKPRTKSISLREILGLRYTIPTCEIGE